MMGVSRPSIREALRALEADGLVNIVPHRGPVVSTISLEEARQLYAARAVLEGFAGRECARLARSGSGSTDRGSPGTAEGGRSQAGSLSGASKPRPTSTPR